MTSVSTRVIIRSPQFRFATILEMHAPCAE